jgi:hypothetical protein
VSPAGATLRVERPLAARRPPADCFYVYPTVSDQPGPQATHVVDDVLRSIATYQAGPFSGACRVYAPVYRQITIQGLLRPETVTPAMREQAYADVREAWRAYLRRHGRGRGVVLLGHSQGTFLLRRLVAEEVDRRPAVRRRLVSALLLGGNVTVRAGRDRGGDFRHVPACRSARQLGCVVAYSAFQGPASQGSRFGRTTEPGREVLCTNPAALAGGAGTLDARVPTAPFAASVIGSLTQAATAWVPRARTAWVELARGYRARCSRAGGAHVLALTPRGGAPDLPALPDATWGAHLVDVSIAAGTLADLVRRQVAEHARRR